MYNKFELHRNLFYREHVSGDRKQEYSQIKLNDEDLKKKSSQMWNKDKNEGDLTELTDCRKSL